MKVLNLRGEQSPRETDATPIRKTFKDNGSLWIAGGGVLLFLGLLLAVLAILGTIHLFSAPSDIPPGSGGRIGNMIGISVVWGRRVDSL